MQKSFITIPGWVFPTSAWCLHRLWRLRNKQTKKVSVLKKWRCEVNLDWILNPTHAEIWGSISRISGAGQGWNRGILCRLGVAVRNSAFCEASLNPERTHNDLTLLIQPMLNMKDIGRHDFHIVNSHLSLSFKNGWSLLIHTFLPFPDTEICGLYTWTDKGGQFNFWSHVVNY